MKDESNLDDGLLSQQFPVQPVTDDQESSISRGTLGVGIGRQDEEA